MTDTTLMPEVMSKLDSHIVFLKFMVKLNHSTIMLISEIFLKV